MSNEKFPDIMQIVRDRTSLITKNRRREIGEVINDAVTRSIDTYFNFIAKNVFGKESKPNLIGFEDVEWEPLSWKYLLLNPKKKNRLFWVSGSEPQDSLQTYFRSISDGSSYFSEKTKVIFKKDKQFLRRKRGSNRKVIFERGEFIVELPFLKGRVTPKLDLDKLGRAGSDDVNKKIFANGNEKKRPFFRPTMVHFAKDVIPKAIRVEFRRKTGYEW